jgi:15-cis-phytoene synthase
MSTDASYRQCRRIVRHSGSNFALAFWLLPFHQRRAMDALYAFARQADDLVDRCAPLAEKEGALDAWREDLRRALAGDVAPSSMVALADSVDRFGIPTDYLFDIIAGVEMDLTRSRYATWEELSMYCDRVAGAVGLACLHIWGFRGEEPVALATACGQAFQLTNILRDLREDAAEDRIYLPLEELQRFDYSVEALKRGESDERFDALMEFQLARATALYDVAAGLHDLLFSDGRRVFRLMFGRYCAILARIRRAPRAVLARRVGLSMGAKLWIAARQLASSRP